MQVSPITRTQQSYPLNQTQVTPVEAVEPVQGQYANLPKSDSEQGNGEQNQNQNNQNQGRSFERSRLEKAVEKAVKALEGPSTNFEIAYQEKSNRIMIKVRDKMTGDVIREIPPDRINDVISKMAEIAGILVDEKV